MENYILFNPSFLLEHGDKRCALISKEVELKNAIKYFWTQLSSSVFKHSPEDIILGFPMYVYDVANDAYRLFNISQKFNGKTFDFSFKEILNNNIHKYFINDSSVSGSPPNKPGYVNGRGSGRVSSKQSKPGTHTQHGRTTSTSIDTEGSLDNVGGFEDDDDDDDDDDYNVDDDGEIEDTNDHVLGFGMNCGCNRNYPARLLPNIHAIDPSFKINDLQFDYYFTKLGPKFMMVISLNKDLNTSMILPQFIQKKVAIELV